MHFNVRPAAVLTTLLICIAILLALNLLGIFYGFESSPGARRIARLVHFNYEISLPTLFSTLILLASALLLMLISRFHKNEGSGYMLWAGLALIFVFLTIDESISFHELISGRIQRHFRLSGFFYFAWVIPYALLLVVIALTYFRFLVRLPRKIMWLFIASGLIYVGGAIGFEMLGAAEFISDRRAATSWRSLSYLMLTTVEELLEMLGISLFIYSLLKYISMVFGPLSISFDFKRGKE